EGAAKWQWHPCRCALGCSGRDDVVGLFLGRKSGYAAGMATRFVNIDRETPMLLPPDLKDWVAKDDLVRFILDAVETCDLGLAKVNPRGSGDRQYPPSMMLSLLIYCYGQGLFSSRAIERATHSHVSVRYLCANEHPDHDTIATFRRE